VAQSIGGQSPSPLAGRWPEGRGRKDWFRPTSARSSGDSRYRKNRLHHIIERLVTSSTEKRATRNPLTLKVCRLSRIGRSHEEDRQFDYKPSDRQASQRRNPHRYLSLNLNPELFGRSRDHTRRSVPTCPYAARELEPFQESARPHCVPFADSQPGCKGDKYKRSRDAPTLHGWRVAANNDSSDRSIECELKFRVSGPNAHKKLRDLLLARRPFEGSYARKTIASTVGCINTRHNPSTSCLDGGPRGFLTAKGPARFEGK